jgi:uncharacterized membrane protein
MIFPILITSGVISLIILIIWSIIKKEKPPIPMIVNLIVSVILFITGIFYIIFPLTN